MSYLGISRLQSGSTMHLAHLLACWKCSRAVIGRNPTKWEYCYCEQLWTYYKLLLFPFWKELFLYIPYTVNHPEWKPYVAEADHYPLSERFTVYTQNIWDSVHQCLWCMRLWNVTEDDTGNWGSLCCSPLHQNRCQELHLCWKTAIVCSGNWYGYSWTMTTLATMCKVTYH